MKFAFATLASLYLFLSSPLTTPIIPAVGALSLPSEVSKALAIRQVDTTTLGQYFNVRDLEKRRGGGGRSSGSGGGRSSSSGSSSSGSGSSGSGSSGSGSSGSTRGGPSNSFSPSSNLGGRTRSGSGARPRFGGGKYYGGGATVPYTAGRRSPLGVVPFLLPLGALAIFPGLWLFGAFAYPWHNPAHFYNRTADRNETLPVLCLCQQYSVCGCDDNANGTYLSELLGDGSLADRNLSLIRVGDVNGTRTAVINGTLPNGTTASGGTAASSADELDSGADELDSGADELNSGAKRLVAVYGGYWVVVALVVGMVATL